LPHVPEGCAARQLYLNRGSRAKPAVRQTLSTPIRAMSPPAQSRLAAQPLAGPGHLPPQRGDR